MLEEQMVDYRAVAGPWFPAPVQSLLSAVAPVRFAQWCHRRYGDVFRMKIFPVGDVVCVADMQLIKKVMTSDPDLYRASDANRLMEFIVGSSSLMMLDGQEHLYQRRTLTPPFRGESVQRYRELVARIVGDEFAKWPLGSSFSVHTRLQDITLAVMIRAVFGITDEAKLTGLTSLVPQIMHMNPLFILFPKLRRDFGPRSPWGRFVRVRAELDEILLGEIARRRADQGAEPGTDVLSLLLAARGPDGREFTDAELRDHLITLLWVGHETSATALAWLFERVRRHPAVLARLYQAHEEGDHRYLDAAIYETLRVRPVVMDVGRVLRRPVELGGVAIPSGVMVALSIGLAHQSPGLFEEPGQFRPERFADGRQPQVFMPFGGGPHRCLGAAFAMMEMREILNTLLAVGRLRTAPGEAPEPVRARGPLLVPGRGAEVVFDAA